MAFLISLQKRIMNNLLDIKDRGADLTELHKRLITLEIGIRAVTVMYDEHSSDKDSKDNIFRLKENFCYRLAAAKHQYLLLLREIGQAEAYLSHLAKHQPSQLTSFYSSNPHFDQVEEMLSHLIRQVVKNLHPFSTRGGNELKPRFKVIELIIASIIGIGFRV